MIESQTKGDLLLNCFKEHFNYIEECDRRILVRLFGKHELSYFLKKQAEEITKTLEEIKAKNLNDQEKLEEFFVKIEGSLQEVRAARFEKGSKTLYVHWYDEPKVTTRIFYEIIVPKESGLFEETLIKALYAMGKQMNDASRVKNLISFAMYKQQQNSVVKIFNLTYYNNDGSEIDV